MIAKTRLLVFVFFAVACAGCAHQRGASPLSEGMSLHGMGAGERRISCEDAYEIDTPIGRLTNNVWNKQAIGNASYEQCLLARGQPSEQYGWSWRWPADSNVVLAFPEVVFGWKPWNGGRSSTERLPASLDGLKSLRLTYDAEVEAHGRHIFSIAVWLTRTGTTREEPKPADITADVNIWLDGSAFEPSGERIAETNVDGSDYEIWYAANMGDASGANAANWTHIVYRSKLPRHRGAVDVVSILRDAVERDLLAGPQFVSSIEIGNEVMSGDGKTWINALALEVE